MFYASCCFLAKCRFKSKLYVQRADSLLLTQAVLSEVREVNDNKSDDKSKIYHLLLVCA